MITHCDEGWSQTLEFNYFTDDGDSLNSSICIYNKGVQNFLWASMLVLACADTLLLLWKSRKKLDWKLLMIRRPWFSSTTLMFLLSSYRLAKPDAFIGEDFFFSFLISIAIFFMEIFAYYIVEEQLKYVDKNLKRDPATMSTDHDHNQTTNKVFILRKLWLYFCIVAAATSHVFWIVTFVESRKMSGILIRMYFLCVALKTVVQVVFLDATLSEICNDMRRIVDRRDMFTSVNGEFIEYIKSTIPSVDSMRRQTIMIGCIHFLLLAGALVWNFWLLCWTYFFPVAGVLMVFYSLVRTCSHVDEEAVKYDPNNTVPHYAGTSMATTNVDSFTNDTEGPLPLPVSNPEKYSSSAWLDVRGSVGQSA